MITIEWVMPVTHYNVNNAESPRNGEPLDKSELIVVSINRPGTSFKFDSTAGSHIVLKWYYVPFITDK
jgi:hypothetical protein